MSNPYMMDVYVWVKPPISLLSYENDFGNLEIASPKFFILSGPTSYCNCSPAEPRSGAHTSKYTFGGVSMYI